MVVGFLLLRTNVIVKKKKNKIEINNNMDVLDYGLWEVIFLFFFFFALFFFFFFLKKIFF